VRAEVLGFHTMFVGEIVGIKADKDTLTNSRPDIQKIKPIIFSSGDSGYHSVGIRLNDSFTHRKLPQ